MPGLPSGWTVPRPQQVDVGHINKSDFFAIKEAGHQSIHITHSDFNLTSWVAGPDQSNIVIQWRGRFGVGAEIVMLAWCVSHSPLTCESLPVDIQVVICFKSVNPCLTL